jgi:hypothetical protein
MEQPINNIYTQFIEYLWMKEYPKEKKLEKHRILPQHDGGTYDIDNVVLCSFEDHRLAHFYRYLAYQQQGDLIAWQLMNGQDEEARRTLASYAGKIGGKASSKINKKKLKLFYDPEWQKLHGYKGAGQRNVESGHLAKLNDEISQVRPEQRSEAGKRGAKARIAKQQKEKTALYDPTQIVQKKGNLVRWGIEIDSIRVPFEKLSSDFVDYHLMYGTKKSYNNPKRSGTQTNHRKIKKLN